MKMENFRFMPILALLVCFLTNAFADDSRSNVKINPATPISNEYRDDGWLDGRRGGWTWNGDQGLYNFTTIKNRSDELNQKPIVRFGGAGTYVFGDYAVTGKPVISLSWPSAIGSGYMWGAKGTYIKDDGDGQFYLNSSKAVLRLPKGVTKDDIVYARLYWQGNIFSTTDFDSEAEYNRKNGRKLTDFAKWYTWVKFKMKSSKGTDSIIKDVQRDRCEGTAAWNFLAKSGKPLRLRLKYGCTKDITDLVKKYFEPYSDSIEFTVGNVRTSDGMDPIGADFTNGKFDNARLGPYGGWGIIVVYDKTAPSRRALLDNLQSNDSVTGQKMTYKEAVEYKNKYFKPKNVTIYGDYLVVTPWNNGYTPININATISGFYTPRSGSVNAKLGFLGFGGERKMTSDEYFKVQYKGTTRMDSLYGSGGVNQWLANDRANIYDGSVALLINNNGTYEYSYPYGTDYLGGFDLDEFDISSKMKNGQSSLNISLGAAWENLNGGQADQNFISMFAMSTDMYVPQMCYQYEVYNAANWLKFFDKNGVRKKVLDVHNLPEQITSGVVAGENIYYRIRFENRLNGGNSEDAIGSIVTVNFDQAGATYTKDTTTINNKLNEYSGLTTRTNAIPFEASQKLVYLKDGQKGAYKTMSDVINASAPNVDDTVYAGRQYTTMNNNRLRLTIGEGAGVIPSGGNDPVGGTMKPGKAAYAEFNATVNTGAKILQAPEMLLSYKIMVPGTQVEINMDGASELEVCNDKLLSTSVNILPLDGLQVVNNNFSKNGDDDRLYTQISEKPFNGKLIFRPDYESHYCKEYDQETGKCKTYTEEAARSKYFIKDPATGKLKYIGGDKKLENFELDGKLFLSVIRAKNAAMTADKADKSQSSTAYSCRAVTNALKIPFKIKQKDGSISDYTIDHELDFKGKSILDLDNIEIADAYQGVTFMLSYRPDGQANRKSNTDSKIEEDDPVKYYLELKRMELRQKYGVCYAGETYAWCKPWSAAEKADKEAKIKEELEKLANNINKAANTFGIAMSDDGSFHVCGSDNFVIRPAYFNVDTTKLSKYGKLIDPRADGDITNKGNKDGKTIKPMDLRIGGDYTENADVLAHMISARSYQGHGVPNYTAVIGGDLGNQKYHLRTSYKNSDADDAQDISTKVRGIQTYLRPFISNQCAAQVPTQSYYIDRDGVASTLKRGTKLDGCYGGTHADYNGLDYDSATGSYSFKKGLTDADIKKNTFGKSNTPCKTNGKEINFDGTFRRVWDKNAISLWADFNTRNITEANGIATYKAKGNVEGSYLLTQSKKDPSAKDLTNAVLYTETINNANNKIFNYYNVGDVLVSVYDNSWTDAYADQTYSKQWKSAKCIINSSTNVPDAKGMVGCDVGMKTVDTAKSQDPRVSATNNNLVLRYRPDRIRLSVVSLDNGVTSGVGSIVGSRGEAVTDNNLTGTKASAFTYFNAPDIENDVVVNTGDNPANNFAVTKQISQLAMLKFNAVAYLSDKVHKDVIATLYDGSVIDVDGKSQAACGFASDLDFHLTFGFDCASNNADGRCAKTAAIRTGGDTDYVPYPAKPAIKYKILGGTEYFAKDSNECQGASGYDSRCYKYNVRSTGGSGDYLDEATSGANFGLPIPLNKAINYYTDATLRGGLINRPQTGVANYDPKSPQFKIKALGFKEGQTPGSTVYFNFARMQKSPSRPVLIYASDFDVLGDSTLKTLGEFWPSKFNNKYDAIADASSENYDQKNIETSKENFDAFITRKVAEYKASTKKTISKSEYINIANSNTKSYKNGEITITDYSDNVGTYALFVYGSANDKSYGEAVHASKVNASLNVPVYSYIYCGRTDKCGNMPAPSPDLSYEAPASNIFTVLAEQDHGLTDFTKFVINTKRSVNSIKEEYVGAYDAVPSEKINVRRSSSFVDGKENLIISAETAGKTTVRILTNPWFIYTPAKQDPRMLTANKKFYASKYSGVPQYFNFFVVDVRAINPNVWGGEGHVKSGKEDDVGSFAGGSDSSNSTSDTSTRILDTGNARDIYNQRIDW